MAANPSSTGYDPLRGTGPGTNPVNPTPYYDPSTGTNPQKTGSTYDPLQGKMVPVQLSPNSFTGAGVTSGSVDTGGGGPTADDGETAEGRYWAQRAAYEAAQRRAAQDSVIAVVQGMFKLYGLESLLPKIEEYARKDYSGDAIAVMLRSTPEYKARFPAMEELGKRGRAISESEYIGYETSAAQLEQRYGIAAGMISGKDSITRSLVNEIGLDELNDRVVIASADSLNAPQVVKDTLRDFFHVDPATALASYYLDPEMALPILQRQSAVARIGAAAAQTGVRGVDRTYAESLQDFGVTEQQAQSGFGKAKMQESLTGGKGDTATGRQLTDANLTGNADAVRATERAARGRVSRFGGGGGFVDSKQGVSGVGAATT